MRSLATFVVLALLAVTLPTRAQATDHRRYLPALQDLRLGEDRAGDHGGGGEPSAGALPLRHHPPGGQGGFGVPVENIQDPCHDLPPDLAFPQATYGDHYHETNSAGSMLAPAVACELVRLLGDPYGEAASSPACAEWDSTDLTGHPPVETPPPGYEPDCPADPTACLIRHY